MLKTFWIAVVFVTAGGMTAARAQTDSTAGSDLNPPGLSKPNDLDVIGPWPLSQDYLNTAGPLNQDYLTATGQTVPRPSIAPIPAPRPNRKIKDLDEKWERSICSNC
jgi:hypothetical protein